jgi:putative endonuclease
MFYVYILKMSKGGQVYIGYTNDLKRRLREHLSGQSEYTKHRLPKGLIYYEAYASEKDARTREINLKQFKGSYGQLKKRIVNSIEQVE